MSYKNLVLKTVPERFHPLLKGVYQTIFFNRGRDKTFDILGEFISDTSAIILECGANNGTSTEKFLNTFSNPTIHAIEPVPKHIEILNEKFGDNKNVIIHETAVGSTEGTVQINITRKSNSTSVFERELLQKYQNRSNSNPELYNAENKIEVSQSRIDALVEKANIIKLDIEGYELNALQGATDILDSCDCVIAEVGFVPLRSGQPLFDDIDLRSSRYIIT